MDGASKALFSLRPVTFHYNQDIDPECREQFGLVAEDVEEIIPDLVVRDKEGKPYSVRYDQVNAMLLNEFLKEHRRNQKQETTIAQLKADAVRQQAVIGELKAAVNTAVARLKEQDAKIQGVSDQLTLSRTQAVLVSQ